MDILMSEFERDYFLINEHGKFHPTYTCDDVKEVKDDMEIIIDYMYINLVITKTAQQSYDEYLNPIPKEPDKMGILQDKVNELEIINGGLLLDQAQQKVTIDTQNTKLKEQEVLNANLLLEVALLKQMNGVV